LGRWLKATPSHIAFIDYFTLQGRTMDRQVADAPAELLDQQVLYQHGLFQRVRRWWRGIHPEKGAITRGWTGWETVEETDHIVSIHCVAVAENQVKAA
jgi:hypothetical protein